MQYCGVEKCICVSFCFVVVFVVVFFCKFPDIEFLQAKHWILSYPSLQWFQLFQWSFHWPLIITSWSHFHNQISLMRSAILLNDKQDCKKTGLKIFLAIATSFNSPSIYPPAASLATLVCSLELSWDPSLPSYSSTLSYLS